MNKDAIEDNEMLYRAVRKSYPDGFKNGKATPALFLDPDGASVDRDGERDESVIIDILKNRFKNYNTAVKIQAGTCREIGTYPIPKPTKNKYHAEIHESETEVEISLLKATQLALSCVNVK